MAGLDVIGEMGRTLVARGRDLLLGPSLEREAKEPPGGVSTLTVMTVHGYEVVFCCEAAYTERRYDRFYVPSRFTARYRIYALVPDDAPERLRKIAGSFQMEIPQHYTSLESEARQKHKSLEMYLDALLVRLDRRVGNRRGCFKILS